MSHKKVKFVVGSGLIVLAVAYLISTGISSTSTYFFTVSELASQQVDLRGSALKIKGTVVDGSIQRDPDDYMHVKFAIEEKDANMNVVYKGVTPDMFAGGREVVVEGTLDNNGVFHANTLLTSCPSKYEAKKESGGMHPEGVPGYPKKNEPAMKSDSLPKTTI